MQNRVKRLMFVLLPLALAACTPAAPDIPVEKESARPGQQVSKAGTPLNLIGTPISVGDRVPATSLVDAATMDQVDLAGMRGQVLFLSVVPSIDTKVCEEQTHYLGEEGDRLPDGVARIVISRDLPFAQKRFAEEADLGDLRYLSDYKSGAFGRDTGLLMEGPMLLARSIILVDREGIIRYLQVVPDITHLPDMEKAFEKAQKLHAED